MNKEELGRAAIISLAFTCISLLLLFINDDETKVLLIFLPLIYGVLFISFARIHHYLNNPGMFLVNCITVIRYVLLPILIIVCPSYTDEYGSLLEGILFMIYEALCLGLFLIFITRRYYRNRRKQEKVIIDKNNYFVLKLVVVYATITILFNPAVLLQYNFFFMPMNNIELIKGRWLITGLSGMVIDWGKLILPLLISINLIKKYYKTKNNIFYYFTVAVILFFNLMIFSGTSRNSVVMPATASMFFLLSVFPSKRKKLFIFLSLAIAFVILRLTLLKVNYVGVSNIDNLSGIIEYLEAYFLGPKNLGVVTTAKNIYSNSFSISTFFNDILGNFPGLSHLFDLENRTNTFYNLVYHHGGPARDAVIPSIGQGLFYFGYLFSFIPQMFIVFGITITDLMYRKAENLASLYFFSYFAVRFGFTYIQNVSIILSFIYSMIIPLSVLLIIEEKIKLRGRVRL